MSAAAWFRSLADLKSEVSSAKSFMSHLMLALKSLMYTRKKRGPRIEPYGTPADNGPHFDALPFKTVHYVLVFVCHCIDNVWVTTWLDGKDCLPAETFHVANTRYL